MFPSVKRAKIFSGVLFAQRIYKQGRRCHEPRSLRNSSLARHIYYYAIQWARGINKRWSIASLRYILLLCVHIIERTIPAGPPNSTDFHRHIYPEIFLGLPPVERINFGLIPLLYVFVLCVCVWQIDKSP